MHIKCLWKLEEDYSSGFEILVNDSSLLIGPLKFSSEKCPLSLISSTFLQCVPWDPYQACVSSCASQGVAQKNSKLNIETTHVG